MRPSTCVAFVLAVALLGMTPDHARLLAQAAPAPAAPAKPAAPGPQDKNQVFRAGVEMVSLNVTVVNSQGRYVTDLAQDDFGVFEDGAKQELSYFNLSLIHI